MPTSYDATILEQFADSLYLQAKWITFRCALLFGFIAFILGFIGTSLLPSASVNGSNQAATVIATVLTVIAVLIGIEVGRRKSFRLKLQAQQILCQVSIERNTARGNTQSAAAGQ